jgi:hypothetical protein
MSDPQNAAAAGRRPARGFASSVGLGLGCYFASSLICVGAVLFADRALQPLPPPPWAGGTGLVSRFAAWDGALYAGLVRGGYAHLDGGSNTVFFPAFPLLGWLLARATGLSPEWALLIVAHVCLAGAFVVTADYLRHRPGARLVAPPVYVLLALAFWPFTFFFRMAYTESLLLLLCVTTLYGLERKWPPLLVALVVGLATASRPVGVVLLAPLLVRVWQDSPSARGFALRCAYLVPVACWGLLGFMLYLWAAFGDPLEFVASQAMWQNRPPGLPGGRLLALATLEPVWSVFSPSSACYWRYREPARSPWLSLYVANPVTFVLTGALLLVGARRRWLSAYEGALAAPLLLIPYVTKGYEMCMAGTARYCAAVLPFYLVLGALLWRVPRWLAVGLLLVGLVFLAAYSAKFALWHPYFY